MRSSRSLHEHWRLLLGAEARARLGTAESSVPATVPGAVHVDLLTAGLIADPLVDRNEDELQWIGRLEWRFVTTFESEAAADGEHVEVVFAGLDTFATVSLNRVVLGRTENQHRTYRFDVGSVLHVGSNRLEVAFAPPEVVAQQRRADHGDLPNAYGQPYNQVRKMAANFGWDWGPRLLTAGIWRAVHLERWHEARLDAIRAHATVATAVPLPGERGEVSVDVEVVVAPPSIDRSLRVDLQVHDPGGSLVAHAAAILSGRSSRSTVTTPVDDVRRWCPIGHGEQPLYEVTVTLECDDVVVDRASRRVGFRDVVLETTPDGDGDGAAFAFVVNGRRTWIRGFNWIPDDCFPARVTPQRLADRIDTALAANANLLRVWGGGVYESDDFYDECDRRGVLVWQDFAFACAAYPEEQLAGEVRAEAIDNVDRLVAHPSLLVWCANNENLWGFADWGWPEQLDGRSWGEGFYRSLLPAVLADHDPRRPYLDGTPTSLDPAVHPNDARRGTVHLWDVWNSEDFGHYRTHAPRFVAEFGFQAPATLPTLGRALAGRPLALDDPGLAHHQKATDGHAKLDRWLSAHFGVVTDADDWLYLTQLNQADALTLGVGHFRSLHERCSGAIWWQLNDCWPAVSWSVVDVDGRRKPSWYAARRAFADRTIVLTPESAGVRLALVNDAATAWDDLLHVVALDADASVVGEHRGAAHVDPDHAQHIALPASLVPGGASDVATVVVTIGDHRAVHEAGPSSPMRLRWDVTVAATATGIDVDVTARTLVRDLCCFAERLDPDAVVDDQLVTLLAGESHRFRVRTRVVDVDGWREALGAHRSLVLRARGDRPTGEG